MYKIFIFFLLIIFSIIFASAQDKKIISIRGHIKGLPTGVLVYLIKNKGNVPDTISTSKSENSKFQFSQELNSIGAIYFVKVDTSAIKFPPHKDTWYRILTNGTDIEINSTLSHWPVATSRGNEEGERYDSISKKLMKLDREVIDEILNQPIENKLKSQKIKTAQQNLFFDNLIRLPNELSTPLITASIGNLLPIDSARLIYENLSPYVKSSSAGVTLLENMEDRILRSRITYNATIPDFALTTPSGENLKILEIAKNNNYTLIDFWASWCAPCKAAFPQLKTIYEKYKNQGFNIIGVSIDKDTNKWKISVSQEKLPWDQTISNTEEVTKLFGIEAIPLYILLDKYGKLISFQSFQGKILSFGPPLDTKNFEQTIGNLFDEKNNKIENE